MVVSAIRVIKQVNLGEMVHAYNSSYLGGRDRRIVV
jgi:hypothetical protein